jgi:uncharacterized membrane protein YgaE (UPF0421/DUF939 family)
MAGLLLTKDVAEKCKFKFGALLDVQDKPPEEWVKQLNMYKRQSTVERKNFETVTEGNRRTTENLKKRLESLQQTVQDAHLLRQAISDRFDQHKWVLDADNRQIAKRDAKLTQEVMREAQEHLELAKKRLKASECEMRRQIAAQKMEIEKEK